MEQKKNKILLLIFASLLSISTAHSFGSYQSIFDATKIMDTLVKSKANFGKMFQKFEVEATVGACFLGALLYNKIKAFKNDLSKIDADKLTKEQEQVIQLIYYLELICLKPVNLQNTNNKIPLYDYLIKHQPFYYPDGFYNLGNKKPIQELLNQERITNNCFLLDIIYNKTNPPIVCIKYLDLADNQTKSLEFVGRC